MIKLSRDKNGNKIVKYSPPYSERGFSVQTLGNMPLTHRMTKDDFRYTDCVFELVEYVNTHGTKHQKHLLFLES